MDSNHRSTRPNTHITIVLIIIIIWKLQIKVADVMLLNDQRKRAIDPIEHFMFDLKWCVLYDFHLQIFD